MTFEVPIWHCLREEVQAELKKRLRKDWTPPVILERETLEELDKLMHQKPRVWKG